MKKRILALALAGTTAFSVFGAAVSANAANFSGTSAQYVTKNDQYKHYTPVASTITTTAGTAETITKTYYIDKKTNVNNIVDKNATSGEVLLTDYLSKVDVQANYTTATKYTKDGSTVTIYGDEDDAVKAAAFGFTIVPDATSASTPKYVYNGVQYDTFEAAVTAAG